MAFHDIRLAEKYSRGSVGGPAFPVETLASKSGREQRNEVRTAALWEWTLRRIDQPGPVAALEEFYALRGGPLHGFRFKWHHQFKLTNENIGTGDGAETDFQLKFTWSDAAGTLVKNVLLPVAGTISIEVDGVPATFTLTNPGGLVSITSGRRAWARRSSRSPANTTSGCVSTWPRRGSSTPRAGRRRARAPGTTSCSASWTRRRSSNEIG